MRNQVLVSIGLILSSQLFAQAINSKVYYLNQQSIVGLYTDTVNGPQVDKSTTMPSERPIHLANRRNTLKDALIRIGSLYSPETRINNGQNRWVIFDSLIISVDIWDLSKTFIPGVTVNFNVVPLYGITQEMSARERAQISNGSNNISSNPLYRMTKQSSFGASLANLVNFDFAIHDNKLIFIQMIDSDTIEVWKCIDEILWQKQTNVKQEMFPFYTQWDLMGKYKFPAGQDGFIAMNLDEDRIMLINTKSEQFILDINESKLLRSDNNLMTNIRSEDNSNVWLLNIKNEPLGSFNLESKATQGSSLDVNYLLEKITRQLQD